MKKSKSIILFKQKRIRRHWDEEKELWYFSIVDIIGILTESINPQAYWRKLKERLKKEGNETVTNCHGLKMQNCGMIILNSFLKICNMLLKK